MSLLMMLPDGDRGHRIRSKIKSRSKKGGSTAG
jgi:hypothetical protein